ncbi:MAG: SpoIIE family protein phosphatase [Phycisphaerales bacterium]
MLGRISVRFLLPLLMALPVAVAAFVLVALWSGHAHDTARTLNGVEMSQIHGRIYERLNTLLRMPARATRVHRNHILEGRLDPDDLRSWRAPLHDFTQAMDMFSGITWGDAQGRATWVIQYPDADGPEYGIADERTARDGEPYAEEFALDDQGVPGQRLGAYAYDPRERPWYVGALAADKATYLAPYPWVDTAGRDGTLGLPFVEPVVDASGRIVGVLAAEMSLAALSDFLRTLRVGEAGYVLILDAEGRLIAHSLSPESVPAMVMVDGAPSVAVAREIEDARVREVAGSLSEALADRLMGTHDIEVGGERMLSRVSAFRELPGLDWRVVTVVPEAELLAPVAAAQSSSHRATIAAVLVTVVLGLGVGLAATVPVRRLVREIRAVGQGDLDASVRPEPTSELTHIAEAVNAMAEDLKDRVRLRESLLVAMEVQKNLLPQESPTVAGLDVAGHSTYCDETGGDYYDYLDVQGVSQSGVALAIGDVMGHGVAAAMLMATARGILRSRCHEPNTLGDLLTHMNELLVEDTGGQRFMTMQLVMLDGADGAMAWASAGHDPPMVYRAGRGAFDELDGGGLPLGLFGEQQYSTDGAEPLQPGDVVVLATDGLWEAKMDDGEFYGKERLEAVIREAAGGTAEAIAVAIRSDHRRLCGGHSQADDITFVVAKRLGAKAAGG